MKREIDKNGRRIYKFSHSVAQGGTLYAHKTAGIIENKIGLRNMLHAIAKKHNLIDPVIKVYDHIFFLFFMMHNTSPQTLIESIQKNIVPFAAWDEDYIWTGVYDLQEHYLRDYLEKAGYAYEEG